jgi:group I intron endonuclease
MKTKLKKGKSIIYSSMLKNGVSKFKLEILEYCKPAKCIKIEQKYINLLKPEYNILQKAGSCLGVIRSEETRAKISASKLGKTRSEVTRAKMSASQMGRKISLEHKANISASMFGKNNAKNQPSSTLQLQN